MDKPILDSGNRRLFESGANRDISEGKGRCDLLPVDIVANLYRGWAEEYAVILDNINNFMETGSDNFIYEAVKDFTALMREDADISIMLLDISKHYEAGCIKYGDRNWQKGIPTHCYLDSAIRHLLKYEAGEEDENHDRAFIWNLLCMLWTKKHHPAIDDIDYNMIRGTTGSKLYHAPAVAGPVINLPYRPVYGPNVIYVDDLVKRED